MEDGFQHPYKPINDVLREMLNKCVRISRYFPRVSHCACFVYPFCDYWKLFSLFLDLQQVKLLGVYTSHLLFCYSSALGSQNSQP